MNNQQHKYLVLLQPLAPFFFGNEQGQTADYYLKGNNFPQQTSLLGLLRHQLLLQNGLLPNGKIENESEAINLIGSESFQYDKTNQTFGAIEEIGECFICYTTQNISDSNSIVNQYHASLPEYANSLALIDDHYVFTGYNPKNYYTQKFNLQSPSKDCIAAISDSNIFKSAERPGIDKNYGGLPKEDAYYKQVWLSMKKGYSFGFYATIKNQFEDNTPVVLKNAIVNFGKESSPFQMVIKIPGPYSVFTSEPKEDQNALYLTSDAYLTEDISPLCEVAVTDTVPFRNIINKVSQPAQSYFNRKPTQIAGSTRLQLYKKGSFFYSKNIKTVAKKIYDQTNFFKAGYNRFQFTTINL